MQQEISIFGIRHHGPACARSLQQALEVYNPDCVLIEGPENAQSMLLKMEGISQLPVAILMHNPSDPNEYYMYPLAVYSPEWIAVQYAHFKNIDIQLIDLPLGRKRSKTDVIEEEREENTYKAFELLAKAQQINDVELWWEINFESTDKNVFESINMMMDSIKDYIYQGQNQETRLREAWMRLNIRKYLELNYKRIAVICGAAHQPFLNVENYDKKNDATLIADLQFYHLENYWIPWSYRRLSIHHGYSAGVNYPLYYEFIYKYGKNAPAFMISHIANYMRTKGYDISPEHAVSACELAWKLAAVRGMPMAGINEIVEAGQAVFNLVDRSRTLDLLADALIGDQNGAITSETGDNPLLSDFEKEMQRLRLNYYRSKPDETELTLDIREANKLEIDIFLYQLVLLDFPWGIPVLPQENKSLGTFKTQWKLHWREDDLISLSQKIYYGHTIPTAAAKYFIESFNLSKEKTKFLNDKLPYALFASLPEINTYIFQIINELIIRTDELSQWIKLVSSLLDILELGSLRILPHEELKLIVADLLPKIIVNIQNAAISIQLDEAEGLINQMTRLHEQLQRFHHLEWIEDWWKLIEKLHDGINFSPGIQGWATAILFAEQRIDQQKVSLLMAYSLSDHSKSAAATAWLTQFVKGRKMTPYEVPFFIPHVNEWILKLDDEVFKEILPLLRKAFMAQDRQLRQGIRAYLNNGDSAEDSFKESRLDATLLLGVQQIIARVKFS